MTFSDRVLEDIVLRYSAAPVTIAAEHRVVLIRINRQFRDAGTPEALYEATRQWWKMDPHRRRPDFAFGVYDGIVRGVYRIDIDAWEQRAIDKRWAFHGVVDPTMESHYVWKDVSSYLSIGNRNPVRYVHC